MFIHAAHGIPINKHGNNDKGRHKDVFQEKTGYALDPVERLNYGVSFSCIDGIYVPTEATYNLMMMMNVPMRRTKKHPWLKDFFVFFGPFHTHIIFGLRTPYGLGMAKTDLFRDTCPKNSNWLVSHAAMRNILNIVK